MPHIIGYRESEQSQKSRNPRIQAKPKPAEFSGPRIASEGESRLHERAGRVRNASRRVTPHWKGWEKLQRPRTSDMLATRGELRDGWTMDKNGGSTVNGERWCARVSSVAGSEEMYPPRGGSSKTTAVTSRLCAYVRCVAMRGMPRGTHRKACPTGSPSGHIVSLMRSASQAGVMLAARNSIHGTLLFNLSYLPPYP